MTAQKHYALTTENIPGVTVAPSFDAATVGLPRITNPRCGNTARIFNWVPTTEQTVVPDDMANLCHTCTARKQCLQWALLIGTDGYWAATTTTDRHVMLRVGTTSTIYADILRAANQSLLPDEPEPKHPAGEGSFHWYRFQQCRCSECRQANAARRRAERAKAATRTAA